MPNRNPCHPFPRSAILAPILQNFAHLNTSLPCLCPNIEFSFTSFLFHLPVFPIYLKNLLDTQPVKLYNRNDFYTASGTLGVKQKEET